MLISGTVLAKLTLTQRNDFFLATSDLSIVEGLANKAASLLCFPFSAPLTHSALAEQIYIQAQP